MMGLSWAHHDLGPNYGPISLLQADGAQSSQVLVPLPDDPYVARYQSTSKFILDTDSEGDELREEDTEEDESSNPDNERESQGLDNEGHGLGDKDHGLGDRSQRLKDKGLGLEEEEVIPKGEQQAVLVVKTAMSESLGLGYGALRRHDLAVEEDRVPNTFEVGQSFRVYTDVLAYAPPAAPVQTLSFPEWSLGSLLVSPSSSVVPSHIASLVATLTATISIDEDQFIESGSYPEARPRLSNQKTREA
nr:hypothetical protein [Tanacetum cinerariifolium]